MRFFHVCLTINHLDSQIMRLPFKNRDPFRDPDLKNLFSLLFLYHDNGHDTCNSYCGRYCPAESVIIPLAVRLVAVKLALFPMAADIYQFPKSGNLP